VPVEILPGNRVICNNSTGANRPFVPATLRLRVFNHYHGLNHPNAKATKKLLLAKYFWPTLVADVSHWCSTCIPCQASKVGVHTKVPPERIDMPERRFQHVHIDIVGPLPNSQGFRYLLTMADRFTRWTEAAPMMDIEALTVAKTFLSAWVARFGVPDTITHDRGTQFESQLFGHISNILGCNRIRTSAYNPRANGMVERFHRQLKGVLKCLKADSDWVDLLPLSLLGIRSTVKADLRSTPAELVYGTTLTLPADMVGCNNEEPISEPNYYVERLRLRMRELQPVMSRPANNRDEHIPTELSTCEFVFLRTDSAKTPLQRPYTGPYEVVARNRYTITIKTNHGQEDVALERVKPARVDPETVTYDLPNRRGRPRANVDSLEPAHSGGSGVEADVAQEHCTSSNVTHNGTSSKSMDSGGYKGSHLYQSRVFSRST
jgi:transposase InsO family protein